MGARDVLFRSLKTSSPGLCFNVELGVGSHSLLSSYHSVGGGSAYVQPLQGLDWPVYSLVERDGKTLSNLGLESRDPGAGPHGLLMTFHETAWSAFRWGQGVMTHGLKDRAVPLKSWWAFFLRYLAARWTAR